MDNKVYVCLMGILDEDYYEPEAVFKNKDDAIAFCEDKQKDDRYEYWDWCEHNLTIKEWMERRLIWR